jgi:hypothetical protein
LAALQKGQKVSKKVENDRFFHKMTLKQKTLRLFRSGTVIPFYTLNEK